MGGLEFRFSVAALEGEIEKDVMNLAASNVRAAVEATQCPTHGEHARVTRMRTVGKRVEFDVEGCCDDLVRQAGSAIGE